MKVVVLVTVLWVAVATGVALTLDWSKMTPNTWGDFLAGVSAPVAFFWLIYGFWMQRKELELQREELSLTRGELKRQASALESQAAIESQKLRIEELRDQRQVLLDAVQSLPKRLAPIAAQLAGFDPIGSPLKADGRERQGITPEARQVLHNVTTSGGARKACEIMVRFLYALGAPKAVDEYGSLALCLQYSNQSAFEHLMTEIQFFKSWFVNAARIDQGHRSGIFFDEAEQVGAIELMKAFQSTLGVQFDWDDILYPQDHAAS